MFGRLCRLVEIMIKITDVANKAGVAKSTVSNVLTGRKYVSDELKERVLTACREMDFQPNFYASRLSKRSTNIIALLLESTAELSIHHKDLISTCVVEASKRGYSLLIYYESDKEKLLMTLRQGRAPIDGAIIMAPCVNDERLLSLENNRIDCTVIGRPSSSDIGYVDVDNRLLVNKVTQKLVEVYGNDVYLINSAAGMTISLDRRNGFAEACEKHGIDVSDRIKDCDLRSFASGYDFAKSHLNKDAAFITADEIIAQGVYKAVEDGGLRIGRDIGVFSLGRGLEHGSFSPKLSYASQNYEQLGRLAVDMLIDEIDGKKRDNILIDSDLHFSESTSKE